MLIKKAVFGKAALNFLAEFIDIDGNPTLEV